MRNSKFIPMLLIPAAFVACTNEDVLDNYAGNEISKNVVEDVIFNVSLDDEAYSRGTYAGATDNGKFSPFKNFYLEPEFYTEAEGEHSVGDLKLTSIAGFAGDMMGFCLTNGANAITNMPFYVAGYGSTKATTTGAKTTVYPFAEHTVNAGLWTSTNDLYNLNLDETLYTAGAVVTKATFDASVEGIETKKAGEALDADELDARKAIVRNNAGVMTGKYIAYYPYNAEFTEPGGVPVKALSDLYVHTEGVTATTREDALEAYAATSLKNNLFAISKETNQVNGKTKSGDVNLSPLTSIAVFKIVNTAEGTGSYTNKGVEIKRIVVTAAANSQTTDFALEGKVALNDLNKIVATKTSALVGVQFPELTVENGYDEEDADSWQRYISIPFYPVSGKQIQIEVYTTDGKVATTTKATAPTLGNAYTWTLDFAELEFVATTRKIFTAEDYVAEIATTGDLKLMRDINVTAAADHNVAVHIEGDYKLTLNAATIGANITMAEGTTIELGGTSSFDNNAAVLTADKIELNYAAATVISNRIVADELSVPAGSDVTLANAAITTVNNKGTLTAKNAEDKTVVFTTLNNDAQFTIPTGYAATVTTVENNAGAEITLNGELTATTINNDAMIPAVEGVSDEVAAAIIDVADESDSDEKIADILGTTTLDNAGAFTWGTPAALDLTVNNSGDFGISSACNFSGVFTNTGNFDVTGNVEGTAGSVTNSADGVMDVTGYFGFTTTELYINAGVVEDNGTINGNANVTVAEGAEFIGKATDANTLVSALSDMNINSKYTGINVVSENAISWPVEVAKTSKKIYLSGKLTFTNENGVSLNGGLEIAGSSTVTAEKGLTVSAVTINADETLTIGASSNITVEGTITNNGTYSQPSTAVVWCTGIAGTGDWGSLKPRY